MNGSEWVGGWVSKSKCVDERIPDTVHSCWIATQIIMITPFLICDQHNKQHSGTSLYKTLKWGITFIIIRVAQPQTA